jgi:hypothetical protein
MNDVLPDHDPLWAQASGGEGHRGEEWSDADADLAQRLYASLSGNTKQILDALLDRPGQRVPADWLAGQLGDGRRHESVAAGRHAVARSLSAISQQHRQSGRRLPFYWWSGADGQPSLYAMKPSVARIFQAARTAAQGDATWSDAEVRATVADYLSMLTAELNSQHYSKAAHRRALHPQLDPRRTDSAIEFKHQNISAAMLQLGLPCIRGYQPRGNYQAALATEIQQRLETDPSLLTALRSDTRDPAAGTQLEQVPEPPARPERRGRHIDYGLLHEEDRRRGSLGEQLVVDYERRKLLKAGRADLAERVVWTASIEGDGLGYDIQSCDHVGDILYIEVKATAYGPDTPFYISTPSSTSPAATPANIASTESSTYSTSPGSSPSKATSPPASK